MRELGNQKDDIIEIQTYLYRISDDYDIPRTPIDGVFSAETEAAVIAFQRMQKLPVTGRVNYSTHTEICRFYSEMKETEKENAKRQSND